MQGVISTVSQARPVCVARAGAQPVRHAAAARVQSQCRRKAHVVRSAGGDYKPTEQGGMKKDGTPDQRTSSEHGFGGDTERASKEGQKGGQTQPDEIYKPKEHGGTKEDGTKDSRTSSDHGFGGDRERASKEGQKGGSK